MSLDKVLAVLLPALMFIIVFESASMILQGIMWWFKSARTRRETRKYFAHTYKRVWR